jgi:hypothetical protein
MIPTNANRLEFQRYRKIQNKNVQEKLQVQRLQLHVYRYLKRHSLVEPVSNKSLDMIHAYKSRLKS